ncbi:uncharacterized protein LOC118644934 [Monomorium pharaonis]|uniref:uncharacterized protein LOC118644934 n=1 Tax=Monomorium pharaonis TaxID=307658 RepID=UPI0017471781|nr:uncharacterized protein LOC118644934 [Monomorium pharaonis]
MVYLTITCSRNARKRDRGGEGEEGRGGRMTAKERGNDERIGGGSLNVYNLTLASHHSVLLGVRTQREKSIKHGESPVEPISSCRDEHGFVPTVGRWGSEWPS